MATIDPLPSSKLHATYDPALIPADDSTGIRPAPMEGRTPIQDRAMKALDVALNIRSCGFNVYLAGDSYLGRQYMLTQYLRPVARRAATPPDLVYVYNFQTPDSPALISLPAGQGRRFRQAMEECVRDIDRDMDRRLAGQRFSKQREKLLTDYQVERTQLIHRMNNVAEHKGFSLDIDESGNMTLYPLVKGRRVSQDDFESLDAGIRIALKHRGEAVAQHMSGLVHALTKMEEGYVNQEKVLEKAAMSAVLDAVLTEDLPPATTAQTGMDALTHAVEAYVSVYSTTKETDRCAEEATAAIFRYLERAYANGHDLEARQEMLLASFKAGVAFTRAGVGNVHAIAHTLGGLYNTAHGLANAVILPIVLEDYGAAAEEKLARLAEITGTKTTGTAHEKSAAFIAAIRAMNARMGIPGHLDVIREDDIPQMVAWALREANPTYPVPVLYDEAHCAEVIRRVRG